MNKNIEKRIAALLYNLRNGRKLCKSLRLKDGGLTEVIYAYEPGGKTVGIKTAELAIRNGHVVPCGDGLFGNDTSQTWILPPEGEQATLFEGAAA